MNAAGPMTVSGVRVPAPLAAFLNDPCMCAASVQTPTRINVGPLSLLVCLTCERAATKVREKRCLSGGTR
jgi:hypothetical protein